MSTAVSDRIEKKVLLRAPRARVWRALTDARELGSWFGANLTGEFAPGAHVRGPVTHKGYEHLTMDVTIERMEPQRLLSWRWHPGATEPGASEPPTLVSFELEEVAGDTMLKVTESGFDSISTARRTKSYRENEEGWEMQMKAIAAHLRNNP